MNKRPLFLGTNICVCVCGCLIAAAGTNYYSLKEMLEVKSEYSIFFKFKFLYM